MAVQHTFIGITNLPVNREEVDQQIRIVPNKGYIEAYFVNALSLLESCEHFAELHYGIRIHTDLTKPAELNCRILIDRQVIIANPDIYSDLPVIAQEKLAVTVKRTGNADMQLFATTTQAYIRTLPLAWQDLCLYLELLNKLIIHLNSLCHLTAGEILEAQQAFVRSLQNDHTQDFEQIQIAMTLLERSRFFDMQFLRDSHINPFLGRIIHQLHTTLERYPYPNGMRCCMLQAQQAWQHSMEAIITQEPLEGSKPIEFIPFVSPGAPRQIQRGYLHPRIVAALYEGDRLRPKPAGQSGRHVCLADNPEQPTYGLNYIQSHL